MPKLKCSCAKREEEINNNAKRIYFFILEELFKDRTKK
jgi:hypothetical protein